MRILRPRPQPQDAAPRPPDAAPQASAPPLLAPRPAEASGARDQLGAASHTPSGTTVRGAEIEPLLNLPPIAQTLVSRAAVPRPEGVLQGLWGRVGDFFRESRGTSELARARRVAKAVAELEPRYAAMSDAELRAETPRLKAELAAATRTERSALDAVVAQLARPGAAQDPRLEAERARLELALLRREQRVLDDLQPEAFAAVREAARRSTGMFPYEVQVLGGALLHRGLIAELYTGEGKTLAATMPAYLDALAGRGVHVATVNDYLARRDAEEMSAIYGFLGMSVGVLESDREQHLIPPGQPIQPTSRREAYRADITYATASELGFDYLRDNQAMTVEDRVQRPLHAAILDEVDSLLLDEARVPLILAGTGPAPEQDRLRRWDEFARTVHDDVLAAMGGEPRPGAIFTPEDIEWEENWVGFTDAGQEKVAKHLGIPELFGHLADSAPAAEEGGMHPELPYMIEALKAHFLMRESAQYAVVDGKISTIGLSGHLGPGRRFTGGLHQALEAKHGVEIQPENRTVASITMRDYLRLYRKSSGMTGTAMSAGPVFREIYGLDVARVPTRKALIRVDYPDKHFATVADKTEQFLQDVRAVHETGRPILVGVEYTHTAEWLGKQLAERGIPVQVLGAKSDRAEADIIAAAGRIGAVTVVTTRGGRGVDIKLGGQARLIAADLVQRGVPPERAAAEAGALQAKERTAVLARGGLLVMGYEHLDSRRRDDQLRGRAARQGDPGATLFYSSVEDRLFDDVKRAQQIRAGDEAWSAQKAPRETEQALTKSENKVNGALIASQPFDQIVANFRDKFLGARNEILASTDGRDLARRIIAVALDATFRSAEIGLDERLTGPAAAEALWKQLGEFLSLPPGPPPPDWKHAELPDVREKIDRLVDVLLQGRDRAVGGELARVMEKADLLQAADQGWSQFLDETDRLRETIHWRAFAQKQPKVEFMREAGLLYGTLVESIARDAAARILMTTPELPRLPG